MTPGKHECQCSIPHHNVTFSEVYPAFVMIFVIVFIGLFFAYREAKKQIKQKGLK